VGVTARSLQRQERNHPPRSSCPEPGPQMSYYQEISVQPRSKTFLLSLSKSLLNDCFVKQKILQIQKHLYPNIPDFVRSCDGIFQEHLVSNHSHTLTCYPRLNGQSQTKKPLSICDSHPCLLFSLACSHQDGHAHSNAACNRPVTDPPDHLHCPPFCCAGSVLRCTAPARCLARCHLRISAKSVLALPDVSSKRTLQVLCRVA